MHLQSRSVFAENPFRFSPRLVRVATTASRGREGTRTSTRKGTYTTRCRSRTRTSTTMPWPRRIAAKAPAFAISQAILRASCRTMPVSSLCFQTFVAVPADAKTCSRLHTRLRSPPVLALSKAPSTPAGASQRWRASRSSKLAGPFVIAS